MAMVLGCGRGTGPYITLSKLHYAQNQLTANLFPHPNHSLSIHHIQSRYPPKNPPSYAGCCSYLASNHSSLRAVHYTHHGAALRFAWGYCQCQWLESAITDVRWCWHWKCNIQWLAGWAFHQLCSCLLLRRYIRQSCYKSDVLMKLLCRPYYCSMSQCTRKLKWCQGCTAHIREATVTHTSWLLLHLQHSISQRHWWN